MTEEKAKTLTVKIFEVILEEINGYSKEEIKSKKLAEECETSVEFQRIQKLIQNSK